MRLKRYLLPTVVLAVAALALIVAPDVSAISIGLDEAAGGAGMKNKSIPVLLGRVLKAALGFVGTLFLILMIYAGFLWMTARGDSKKVDTAKQLIAGAIIGVVIIAGAYAMTDFVIKAVTGTAETTTESAPAETPEAPSCTASCAIPLDCGGIPDSCGCVSSYSCKCADGTLSTNGFPCPSSGSCVCAGS